MYNLNKTWPNPSSPPTFGTTCEKHSKRRAEGFYALTTLTKIYPRITGKPITSLRIGADVGNALCGAEGDASLVPGALAKHATDIYGAGSKWGGTLHSFG